MNLRGDIVIVSLCHRLCRHRLGPRTCHHVVWAGPRGAGGCLFLVAHGLFNLQQATATCTQGATSATCLKTIVTYCKSTEAGEKTGNHQCQRHSTVEEKGRVKCLWNLRSMLHIGFLEPCFNVNVDLAPSKTNMRTKSFLGNWGCGSKMNAWTGVFAFLEHPNGKKPTKCGKLKRPLRPLDSEAWASDMTFSRAWGIHEDDPRRWNCPPK